MLSSFVRVCLFDWFYLSEKHLLPFIRIQRAFVPNFFQKNLPSLLVAQLLRRLYEKNLVVEKKPLITDRDKNRSFDSLFFKKSEIFSPVKTSPYLIRHEKPILIPSSATFLIQRDDVLRPPKLSLFNPTVFCVLSGVPSKKSPHCIDHGNAIFRSLFEKIHRSFTFPRLRCLFEPLRKSLSCGRQRERTF